MFVDTTTEVISAYSVLGVSESDTLEEIRLQYRRLIRTSHPDRAHDDASATLRTQQLNYAWEVLQQHHVDVPKPQTTEFDVDIDELTCRVVKTVTNDRWYSVSFVLRLPMSFFKAYPANRSFSFESVEEFGYSILYRLNIDVISEKGDVVFTSNSWELWYEYHKFLARQRTEKFQSELDLLRRRLDRIPLEKKPSTHVVFGLIRELEQSLSYSFGRSSVASIEATLRRISAEIDRMDATDPVEVAVDQLMSNRWPSLVHQANLQTAAAINAASVRTGGYIEPFTEQFMREFYTKKLQGFSNPLSHLEDQTLVLELDDFAPEEVVEDPDLRAAPLMVRLWSNKGEAMHYVRYQFDSKGRPVAIVCASLRTCKHHAPAYKSAQGFPELPYGIIWIVEVVHDGRTVMTTEVNAELHAKLTKWEKAKSRSKHADDRFTLGLGMYGSDPGEVPPWYVGKATPGRRR